MKAYEHQKRIIDDNPKKTGLFLGTGTGKSFLALSLAQKKTLVICPKTLKEDSTWERQLSKMNKQLVITVISKENFRRDAHKLTAYETVIVDEAHTCLGVTPNVQWKGGNPLPKTSQIYDALYKYIARTKPKRIYLCTATIIRSPMTVWAAGKILGKDWNFYSWRDAFYFRLPMSGREVYTAKNDAETKDRLARAVQRLGSTGQLSDYFDVPEQTFKTDYIDLTEKQEKKISELFLDFPDPLVLLGKKHQVENGVLSGDEFNAPEYFDNEKLAKIKDYALEFPRMVIFAKYRAQIEQIASMLKDTGKKALLLTGDTEDRGSVILEANNSPECIFIAQSQISSGWELPGYPVMIFASLDWSIVNFIQGQGRILRANSLKKNLYINLVVRGGIDEAVFKSIQEKRDFNERIYLNL